MYILIGSSALMVTSRLRSHATITSAMAKGGRRLGPVGVGPMPTGRRMERRWDFGGGPFQVYWLRRGRTPRAARWV